MPESLAEIGAAAPVEQRVIGGAGQGCAADRATKRQLRPDRPQARLLSDSADFPLAVPL